MIRGGLAGEQAEEALLHLFRDRATAAAAHDMAVDRAHRRDLGGGAGEEDLVGDIEAFARQGLLAHVIAFRLGQLDHAVTGQAGQDGGRGRRRADDAVGDDEDVLAGAFGHQAVDVQADAFVEAARVSFMADQH